MYFCSGIEELRCLFDENCINETCKRVHTNKNNDTKKGYIDKFSDKIKKNEIFYSDMIKKEKIQIKQNKINIKEQSDDLSYKNIDWTETIDDEDLENINEFINIKFEKKNNVDILIKDMENSLKSYIKKIKYNINIIEKHNINIDAKLHLIFQLNKILSEMQLFKENYKDTSM